MSEKVEFEGVVAAEIISPDGGYWLELDEQPIPKPCLGKRYKVTLEPAETEPKPCPHCESSEVLIASERRFYLYYFARCDKCYARGPESETPEGAKKGWNRREAK